MQMRVVVQGLAPRVQHGDRPDLGAEVPRVSGDVAQRVGGGAEQDGIDDALVLERDFGRRRGQCEDHVVVGHRQQLGLTRLEPLRTCQALALRTVPVAAGIVGVAHQPAVATLLDMTAERGCPARLDRRDDATLDAAEMCSMIAQERRAVAAEHIRHLQRRSHHRQRQRQRQR